MFGNFESAGDGKEMRMIRLCFMRNGVWHFAENFGIVECVFCGLNLKMKNTGQTGVFISAFFILYD